MSINKLFQIVSKNASKNSDKEISLASVYRIMNSRKPVSVQDYMKFSAIGKPRFYTVGGYHILDVDVIGAERHKACLTLFGAIAQKQGVTINTALTEAENLKALEPCIVRGNVAQLIRSLMNECAGTTIIGSSQNALVGSIDRQTMLQGNVELVYNELSGFNDVRISGLCLVKAVTVAKSTGTLAGIFGSELALDIDIDGALAGITSAEPAVGETTDEDAIDKALAGL